MKSKNFGPPELGHTAVSSEYVPRIIVVYTTEKSIINEVPKVEINWQALGDVQVSQAELFRDALTRAIEFAKQEEIKVGLGGVRSLAD
jgi:hypothetical protein